MTTDIAARLAEIDRCGLPIADKDFDWMASTIRDLAAKLAEAQAEVGRLRETVIAASEVNRPFPPLFEDTNHNRDIWNVAYGYGTLDAVTTMKEAIKP